MSSSSLFTPALLRTHSFVFFAVHETRRIFLSPGVLDLANVGLARRCVSVLNSDVLFSRGRRHSSTLLSVLCSE